MTIDFAFSSSCPLALYTIYFISGVGVRLNVGINIEKSEGGGVGSGERQCPPSWGSGGLPPESKTILR